jgi:hypothetical protein
MVVLGGVFVGVLLRPRRPGTARRVAALRAAGSAGTVLELAYARASVTLAEPDDVVRSDSPGAGTTRVRWRPRLVRASRFAVIGVGLGAAAHRIAEGAWPPAWVLAATFAALAGIGLLAYARARLAWHWAVLVTGSQLLLNAAFSAVALFLGGHAGGTAEWSRLLFCYHGGAAPSAAQVSAAVTSLGPNAAKLLPASGSPAGVLIWAAFAHFLAAVAVGLYVVYGESAVRLIRARISRRRLEDALLPLADARHLQYVS